MKLKYTAAAALTAFAMAFSVCGLKTSAFDAQTYADQVIILANRERQAQGLSPLYAVPELHTIAAQRSSELVQTFSHYRPDGSDVSSILNDYGIGWWSWGENIAYGHMSPAAVMNGWMHSTGHKANILTANFQYIGVGVASGNNTLYWTQVFINGGAFENAYLPTVLSGDLDGDNVIDSSDAALILIAAAELGAGHGSGLDVFQEIAADVNQDNEINSIDAAYVLEYAAAAGVQKVTLSDIISGNVT